MKGGRWSSVRFREALRAVRSVAAEITVSVTLLGGWALVTWGIARLTSVEAWIFSGGVLLLSLTGWRWMFNVMSAGLYDLSKSKTDDG